MLEAYVESGEGMNKAGGFGLRVSLRYDTRDTNCLSTFTHRDDIGSRGYPRLKDFWGLSQLCRLSYWGVLAMDEPPRHRGCLFKDKLVQLHCLV